MNARAARIEVVIDELVLHGFPVSGRDEVARALRSELASSLAGWRPGEGRDAGQVDGGSFILAAGATPEAIGRQIARQVGVALGSGPASSRRPPATGSRPPAPGNAAVARPAGEKGGAP
jgi:hypothetical protein